MRKKKILFVIDILQCGGAEKSLLTLLSLIDYTKYEVDLQLFWYGGSLEKLLPKGVHLLPPSTFVSYWKKRYRRIDLKNAIARIKYAIAKRLNTHGNLEILAWKYLSPRIAKNEKKYDVSIAYGQGLSPYYVIDKTYALYKIGWVNCMLRPNKKEYKFRHHYYSLCNAIVIVSDKAYDCLAGVYPDLKYKMSVMYDMLDADIINRMSMQKGSFPESSEGVRLLTVARLENPTKGYDISLRSCSILKERGLKFKWYVIGEGSYRKEMEKYIRSHHLEDTYIMLGEKTNPYPDIRNCDIYVQTSRLEGYCLAIAEARILNKPVVTTEFEAVYCQMVQGKNGLVVPMDNPVAVADAIERLMTDKALYASIVAYLQQEKKGNTEGIKRFYELIEHQECPNKF